MASGVIAIATITRPPSCEPRPPRKHVCGIVDDIKTIAGVHSRLISLDSLGRESGHVADIGTSGCSTTIGGRFYPKGTSPTQLAGVDATRFEALEVKQTFYRLPMRRNRGLGDARSRTIPFAIKASTLPHPLQEGCASRGARSNATESVLRTSARGSASSAPDASDLQFNSGDRDRNPAAFGGRVRVAVSRATSSWLERRGAHPTNRTPRHLCMG